MRLNSQRNPTVCAVVSNVARPLSRKKWRACVLSKGLVSVYFRYPAKAVSFSGTRLYLCVQKQPS